MVPSYPSDSTYLWWNKTRDSSAVTFFRDSLYVVGGSLSVDCSGALKHVLNIDNSFSATTDTVINDTAHATKLILIDVDPSNDNFEDSLITERFKAIAWQEGAGMNNQGRNRRMPRWNNYWGADSTRPNNSRMPCEGDGSKDSGIMQLNRHVLEKVFNGSYDGSYPEGRFYCEWDSLTWNWKLNIFNAKWWTEAALCSVMTDTQKLWPDSCSYTNCDSLPRKANKEDLSNYGYHAGETRMKKITTDDKWKEYILEGTDDFADYARKVRRWKYNGNLW